jgi:pyruvate kinase
MRTSIERRTKIVCTLGPATDRGSVLRRLVRAGMDVARLNFSHGVAADHVRRIEQVRAEAQEAGRTVAILQDLQGPKIRLGDFADPNGVLLNGGREVLIMPGAFLGTAERIATTYRRLAHDVKAGDSILINDGAVELRVLGTDGQTVRARVVRGGRVLPHKGLNMPGCDITAPPLTEKDLRDLEIGLEHEVDYVALSFVRRAHDVLALRRRLRAANRNTPIIAKLEKPEAIENLDEILSACEGVMVARGDLGVELSPEVVPLLQKKIIRRANAAGRIVITATQMLESMIQNPRPTRAEASDVANAILDGTDAVMLSGETAAGAFPVEAFEMMSRIAFSTQQGDVGLIPARPDHRAIGFAHALSHAARQIAQDDSEVQAIACYTKSGTTARLLSKDRPGLPVYAFSPDAHVRRQLALYWGVTPFTCPPITDFDGLLRYMDKELLQRKLVRPRAGLVVLAGAPLAFRHLTNSLRLHRVGETDPAGR